MSHKRALLLTIVISLLFVSTTSTQAKTTAVDDSSDYIVENYLVDTAIHDNTAVTQITQTIIPTKANADPYLLPIPDDSNLTNLEVILNGKSFMPERLNTDTTNKLIQEKVETLRQPQWLTFIDSEMIAININDPSELVIRYTQTLPQVGGLYHYHHWLHQTLPQQQSTGEVQFTLTIESTKQLANIYAPNQTINISRPTAQTAHITWQSTREEVSDDFELFFATTETDFAGALLTGQMANADHFLFLLSPAFIPEKNDALPKDLILVIDRSGSMSGEKIDQAKAALQFILGQLNENDRFSIVSFDDTIQALAPTLQPANSEQILAARNYVDQLFSGGSTDIDGALQHGFNILESSETRPGAAPMIIFLTDGLPTAGISSVGEIAGRVRERNTHLDARLHVFGVGYDVNTHLLDQLAVENHGAVTYVQPGENLEAALSTFYSSIANPLLTDLVIEFENAIVTDLHPQQLPDIFQGSQLLLTGKFEPTTEPINVIVSGKRGEEPYHATFTFTQEQLGNFSFVPRLWATRQAGKLLDEVRLTGEESMTTDIRSLGLGYGIVTPYTLSIIQTQVSGAASANNMSLYGLTESLSRASGETAIQARVQNLAYQNSAQANLAQGANISGDGRFNFAQIGNVQFDLTLIPADIASSQPVSVDWLRENVGIDQEISFASEAYFELAQDPAARSFLQSGNHVLFSYKGEVIFVQDSTIPIEENPLPTNTSVNTDQSSYRAQSGMPQRLIGAFVLFFGVGFLLIVACCSLGIWLLYRRKMNKASK